MTTMGRRRPPTKRSRGAKLDSDLGRLTREACRLEREASGLRAEMCADLSECELIEDSDRLLEEERARAELRSTLSAQTLQQHARGALARVKKSKDRRDELARNELRAQDLETSSRARRQEASVREKERTQLKRVEQHQENKRRAAELERERRMLDQGKTTPIVPLKNTLKRDLSKSSLYVCISILRS